ncbi:regulator of DNA class I crossover intermediates 1 [Thomomys bottae]
MKLLGVLSPAPNSAVSLDLLNLYMVNQISCKKKTPETMKKPVHVNMNRDIKIPLRKHDLELPMSPNCTPSKLCLDDAEDNIHSQEQGNKEELIQLSQHMGSYRMFAPQFHRRENCSYPSPSFSTDLSSNKHSPRQKCTPRVTLNPWKPAYETTQNNQLSEINCSDSLVSKLRDGQDVLNSSYKVAQFGTLFGQLQSPGNEKFLTPAISVSEDCRSMDTRRPSDFIIKSHPVQDILEDNKKEFSSFLGNMTQPTHMFASESQGSFVNQNIINLLSIDQQRIKEPFDKCVRNNFGESCAVTPSENHFIDGCSRDIFTVPEMAFSCYPEACQSVKNYQRECNDEINDGNTSFEENCYSATSENNGKLKNDYQEKIPQKNTQQCLEKHIGAFPLEDPQYWAYGLGENVMEERGTSSLQGTSASTKKTCVDSSQSSLSASYSPRPTESSFSSSSDLLSEDEDQTSQQIEDSRKTSPKITETAKSCYPERMGKCLGDQIVKDNAEVHTQNGKSHQVSLKNSTDPCPQSPCNSTHIVQIPTNTNCIVKVPTCDAGVQTEREPSVGGKVDAATQCSILSPCVCRSCVSPLHSSKSCGEDKEDTTRGQESLQSE